jgi:hypothetical protein
VTLRDFVIFQVKLLLDGAVDVFAFCLSIGAILVDLIAGRGKRPRLFYSVGRLSERFDKWINLHGVVQWMDEVEREEGLFGGTSDLDDDNLVSEIERLVQRTKSLRGQVEPSER